MVHVVLWAVGAIGAAVVTKLVLKETRRINAELDRIKAATANDPGNRPELKRDPKTGIYRPN